MSGSVIYLRPIPELRITPWNFGGDWFPWSRELRALSRSLVPLPEAYVNGSDDPDGLFVMVKIEPSYILGEPCVDFYWEGGQGKILTPIGAYGWAQKLIKYVRRTIDKQQEKPDLMFLRMMDRDLELSFYIHSRHLLSLALQLHGAAREAWHLEASLQRFRAGEAERRWGQS